MYIAICITYILYVHICEKLKAYTFILSALIADLFVTHACVCLCKLHVHILVQSIVHHSINTFSVYINMVFMRVYKY